MASAASETGNPTGATPQRGITNDPLVWIDCEMTGLNPDTEEIIEIYCILTTGNLEILDEEGYHAIIHFPSSRMDQMDEWCTKTHGNSGLTEAVINSTTTPEEAADGLYAYITKFIPEKRKALLAGNSIHADRMFLRKEPYAKALDHLHYRLIDVTSIKEAARRWAAPRVVKKVPSKKGRHQARDDILESIEEAKYYREVIFGQTLDKPEQPQQSKKSQQKKPKTEPPGRQMIPNDLRWEEGERKPRRPSNTQRPGWQMIPGAGGWQGA